MATNSLNRLGFSQEEGYGYEVRAALIHMLPFEDRARWHFLGKNATWLQSFCKEQNRTAVAHIEWIRRAHPHWLIFPTILCILMASGVGALAQDSEQVALADPVPDSLYRSQPATVEPPPPPPEELGDALMLHQRYQAAIEVLMARRHAVPMYGTRWESHTR